MIWQSGLVNKSVVVGTYHMPGIKLLIARQRVLIRNTHDPAKDAITAHEILSGLTQTGVPNYYGYQQLLLVI